MGQKFTAEDIKKIEAEIEDRKLNKRPKLIEAVKVARAQGDLSENFEYYAAKREKNQNEGRINYLERLLRTGELVEDNSAPDEVGLNDTVKLYIVEDKEEVEYKITTPIRADSLAGRISIESPLGKALLGHKIGETLTVTVSPQYSFEARIIDLDKSTDEGEDINSF